MRLSPQAEEVRRLVARMFETLGIARRRLLSLGETILIERGKYVARTYRVDGYMAMWLVSVGIVQFYDAEGEMLATVNLFEEFQPQRQAA